MDTYSLIGFNSFTSKKGNLMVILYVTYSQSNIQGTACDKFFANPDCISGDLYVGADLRIMFSRSGYVQRVEIV